MKFDKEHWKELDINVDSLWIMGPRAKGGKHTLPQSERKTIGIEDRMRLIRIDERHKPYLRYHNERCFLG